MSSRTLLTATAVAVLILSVVGVVSALRSRAPAESPSEPAQPVSITSTTNTEPEQAPAKYWTRNGCAARSLPDDRRIRSNQPGTAGTSDRDVVNAFGRDGVP